MQSTLNRGGDAPSPYTPEEIWTQLAPHLEAAMGKLAERDRALLVLRFYENKSGPETAALLGIREDAAHKRVARAIEKLRKFFAQRGVTLSGAAIAGAVSANSVSAAPVALVKTISVIAAAKGAAATTSTLTLVKGALKIMAWTKMQTAIVVGVGVLLAAGTATVVVKVIDQRPMMVQGKTESEWIKSIVYFGDDNQTKLWHSLGQKGIQMLVRALKFPPNDRDTRMRAASLLCQLGTKNEAQSAIPELIDLLKTEKDDSVRAIELSYFEVPIQTMDEKEKAALFPELLRAMQSKEFSVRNNALVAIEFYPKQTVVPLIVNLLQDSSPQVRLMAVKALNKVDPQVAAKSDVVQILVECSKDPETANNAVVILGELHREPGIAVPALIQSLQSADPYVRQNSAGALGRFGGQAKAAIPALTKALEDSNSNVRLLTTTALKLINSDAPAK